MSKWTFTRDQIEDLLKNENVLQCSEKTITYSTDFKIRAVGEHQKQYLTPKEIFRKAGFDLEVLGEERPRKCLEQWSRAYRLKGIEGLADNRGKLGGRPKVKGLTDKDKIKRLEAKVAYLQAENDFLAKLRAKRAE
ncbi:MAG: hypothetical protein OS130_10995 [Thermodesulfobacteriota bacterium]|jgi:transposase-like protein|nr:MAG: hypothetical protein OS130_10995 [Thermodesulfobacteriota bacterium]